MEWSDLRRRLKTIFAGEAEARAGGSASAGGLLQFRRRESPRDSNTSDYSSDALSEDGQCSGQCSGPPDADMHLPGGIRRRSRLCPRSSAAK